MYQKIIENLNDLYIFYVVAKKRSFTSAAEELFVSQPAITKRIKNLENRLGFPLFQRRKSKLELTEFGIIFFKKLDNIFNELRILDQELKALKEIEKKHLKIGSTPSYSEYLMPQIISNFTKLYPNIKISLYSESSEKLIKLISNKKLDLAIIALWKNLDLREFKFFPFRKEEIIFICNNNHNFANHIISFEELSKLEFVVRDESSGTRKFVENQLKKRGIKLNIKFEVENYKLIKEIVKRENVVSFLAKTTIEKEIENNEISQIHVPEKFFIDIGIIANKSTCPELDRLIEILKMV